MFHSHATRLPTVKCLRVAGKILKSVRAPPGERVSSITPVIPEDYAAQGLVHVRRFVKEVGARNGRLRWLGLLIAMVQKVSVHKVYEGSLRTAYAGLVFNTTIPLAAVFKEAVASRQPITHYKRNSAGARAVCLLRDELSTRVNETSGNREAA